MQAHNGSGKTTCFVLGMLSRVDGGIKAPQAMCICPTRELVVQNVQVRLSRDSRRENRMFMYCVQSVVYNVPRTIPCVLCTLYLEEGSHK